MSKCPYVPPHEWNVDFPHLMLRAKAVRFKKQGASLRDKLLASTDAVGKFAGIPVIAQVVNASNRSKLGRKLLESTLGVHHEAPVPALSFEQFAQAPQTAAQCGRAGCGGSRRNAGQGRPVSRRAMATATGRKWVRTSSPCSSTMAFPLRWPRRKPVAAWRSSSWVIWMPSQGRRMSTSPVLAAWVDKGWDIVTPIPSCTLMYKQELPLMFPDDPGRRQGSRRDVRPLRVPDASAQGRQVEDGLPGEDSAMWRTRCRVICACRILA